jgi:hypothetical protein
MLIMAVAAWEKEARKAKERLATIMMVLERTKEERKVEMMMMTVKAEGKEVEMARNDAKV